MRFEQNVQDELKEATAWYLRLESDAADVSAREEFRLWLNASVKNKIAFEQVLMATDAVVANAGSPEIMAIRDASLTRVESAARQPQIAFNRIRAVLTAAVVLCLIATALVFLKSSTRSGQIYQTATNERREVVLEDGSRVSLDKATRIEVMITTESRNVDLEIGQARFQVSHDRARPFTVTTGSQIVLATGTDFNVERLSSQSIVTLIDGRVLISMPGPQWSFAHLGRLNGPAPTELWPGDQFSGPVAGAATIRRHIGLSDATAWQRNKIAFDNEPLNIAVERMNRYRKNPIQINDRAVSDFRMSGIFNTADTDSFIEAVTAFLPLRSVTKPDGVIILSKVRPENKTEDVSFS